MGTKKLCIFLLSAAIAVLMSACGNDEEKVSADTEKIEYKEISASAIEQTVADMETRENVKDASFTIDGNKISMKVVAENISTSDKEGARQYADEFLRSISMYVDDNHPTKYSYGKIYDGYYVNIIVEDPNGMQAIEGNMYPNINSITWE